VTTCQRTQQHFRREQLSMTTHFVVTNQRLSPVFKPSLNRFHHVYVCNARCRFITKYLPHHIISFYKRYFKSKTKMYCFSLFQVASSYKVDISDYRNEILIMVICKYIFTIGTQTFNLLLVSTSIVNRFLTYLPPKYVYVKKN